MNQGKRERAGRKQSEKERTNEKEKEKEQTQIGNIWTGTKGTYKTFIFQRLN